MPNSGITLSFIFFVLIILLNSSCGDKTFVAVRQNSSDTDIQIAYINFLNSIKENPNPNDPQVFNNFIKAKSVLNDKELLLLYSKMGEYYFKIELADSALIYFISGLEIASDLGNEYYISYFHMKLGETLNFLSDFDPALVELKTAYGSSLALDSFQLQIKSARNLGNVYWNKGDYELALTYYLNSLDISRKFNDSEGITAALNNIGIIYQEIRDYEKAIDYYKQAEVAAEKDHFVRLLASSYNNVGDVYSIQKEYDSALVYFKKALSRVSREDSKFSAGIYLGNIADVYLKTDSLEKAKQYFQESLLYATETNDKIGIASCKLGLADVFLKENNTAEAAIYLKSGTEISKEIGSFKLLDYAYHLNSSYFQHKKDYSNSHLYIEKQLAVRDSFASLENGENVARLENRYKEVQNIKQIEILKAKQKNFINLLILGFTAFIIIFLVIFMAYRQKSKSNLLLNEKNILIGASKKILEEQHQQLIKSQDQLRRINKGKDVFLTIISHDLKNPLSAVRGFTELLVQNYDKLADEKRKLFLNEILDSIERITLLINNVLYWVKSQNDEIQFNPVKFSLNKRIDDNTSLFKLMMNKKEIQLENIIGNDLIVLADINVFDMILRNILSNSLKFTPSKGKIVISTQVNGQKVKLSISDNGIGIPEDKLKIILSRNQQYSTPGTNHEQGTGLGLELTHRFIEQTGGNFEILSEPDKGTTISFTLDLTD